MRDLTDEGLIEIAQKISLKIDESIDLSESCYEDWSEWISTALQQVRDATKAETREACAKVAESRVLTPGEDGFAKSYDYECSTCGGDIRGMCCVWKFNHTGNVFIARAIRQMDGGNNKGGANVKS